MKTHIINLERHDDLASVSDKLAWGTSGRIILVWPPRTRLFTRKLDLVRLSRLCEARGAQLALVVRHPAVLFHAAALGIPVFRSLRKAQRASWDSDSQEEQQPSRAQPPDLERLDELRAAAREAAAPRRKSSRAARAALFALGLLAFLVLAAAVLPGAEIRLSPQSQTQSITLEVSASPDLRAYSLSGALPARSITVIVEGRDALATTGSLGLPQERASGTAEFTNLTDQIVNVPAGTVLRTLEEDPIRFLTTRDGQLDAQAGASLSLPIEALNPGAASNLPAGDLATVDGSLGLSLSVTNPSPTRGGSDQATPAPSEADYEKLREDLLDALQRSALLEVGADLHPGDYMLTAQPVIISVLEEEFSPPNPQPAVELSLTLRAEFEVQIVTWSDLQALTTAVLDANLPPGFAPQEDSLTITHLSEPLENQDSDLAWSLQASRNISFDVHGGQAASLSINVAPQTAAQRLNSAFVLEQPAEIRLIPSWWPWMPLLPLRISVVSSP